MIRDAAYKRADASRKRARKRVKPQVCEVCLGPKRFGHIHVHHRDGNPLNNARENLASLCVQCHADEHLGVGRVAGKNRWIHVCYVCRTGYVARPDDKRQFCGCSPRCRHVLALAGSYREFVGRSGEVIEMREAVTRIEKGVPYPPPAEEKKRGPKTRYPLLEMEVGDSFFVERGEGDVGLLRRAVRSAIRRAEKASGWKFQNLHREETGVDGVRVWRTE